MKYFAHDGYCALVRSIASVIPYPPSVVGFPETPDHGTLEAFVALAAFPVIEIPAVPAEILAAVRAVRADPSPRNAVAFAVPVTSSLYPGEDTQIPTLPFVNCTTSPDCGTVTIFVIPPGNAHEAAVHPEDSAVVIPTCL